MPRIELDPRSFAVADLRPAIDWIRGGGIVAYPTDTLYGLAADPSSSLAVQALFEMKGRDASAAIPLIAASTAQVEAWCALSPASRRLATDFWPGPLSLVCDAPERVVPEVHGGRGTMAIRVPDHPVARALAAAWGGPLTATSANRSGEPAAQTAAALSALHGDRLLVIDAGATAGGSPSTIVDARGDAPQLVRAGAIPWDRVLHSLQR
jgi:L-threonylcarbamoyladenylate synthase